MPAFDEFCSPAYKVETTNVESSVMRNCYLETIEKGPRAGKLRVRGIPGLRRFTTLDDAPLRSLLRIDSGNRLFAVAGSSVYEVFRDRTFSKLTGDVALSPHPAIMVSNGFQLAIASGGIGYLVEGGTPGTVSPIHFTDGTLLKAGTIDFLDQYFIANQVDSKQIYISGLAPDGGTWDPGDTGLKEGYPDNISRVFADNQQLWLFGFDTTEPFIDTGALFPFERQGIVIKIGCSAPYSVAAAKGYRFWLWQNTVYAAYGVTPERVSDCGVEEALRSYGSTVDAEGWCQAEGAHLSYVLTVPGKGTWVYDVSTKAWHERLTYRNGKYEPYRARVYAAAFDLELVGDNQTGDIWEMSHSVHADGPLPRRIQRTCPYVTDGMKMLRYNQLTLDMDTGIGLNVPAGQPGYDPQVVLRYSDDRGKTYGNELQDTAGKFGETKERVIFNQLGSSRIGKTFEVTFTDPCPFSVNGAQLKIGQREEGR